MTRLSFMIRLILVLIGHKDDYRRLAGASVIELLVDIFIGRDSQCTHPENSVSGWVGWL